MFPPSPALSFVDSLDGIEDLEAYLDAQPALSQFPTPPPGVSKNGKGLARITTTPAGIVTQHLLQNLDENPFSISHDETPDRMFAHSIDILLFVCLSWKQAIASFPQCETITLILQSE
jgi:hypothetical protein